MLFPYPEKTSGAHIQKAWKLGFLVDVEVLHGSYLLAVAIVDVETAEVLQRISEA